jgi:dolichol kinase
MSPARRLLGGASLERGELARRIVHVGCAAFAFLLRWLDWRQAALLALAAFVFNWQVLPRLGGKGMWRGGDVARGYSIGILAYPLSVLALVLVFHDRLWMAAAGWGILAVGDGMASLVGQAADGPRLPWNERKSWVGFAAFVFFGAAAGTPL